MNSKTRLRHFRATSLMWPLSVITLALSILLSPVQAQLDLPVGVLSTVQETGSARIIVTLKMPEQPDNGLAGTASLEEQKTQVNKLQWEFFRELNPTLEGELSGALDTSGVHQFRTIPAVAMEINLSNLDKIKESDLVADVEIDVAHPATLSDSIPLIGANLAWNEGYSGAGQVVAVLDTGVDKTHPALQNKVIEEACFSTTSSAYNATSLCPDGSDAQIGEGAGVACSGISGCDHGTHVAGIVAAEGSIQGVAKDADIIAIQVFSRFEGSHCGFSAGPCVLSYTSDQMAGLEQVWELAKSGMDIASANMSLGGGNYPDVCNGSIKTFIDKLKDEGVATIVSSGNSGYKDGIASPACIESAISIGSTSKSDTVASYSNSADTLDLLAPGSSIESALPGGSTGMKSGTSMAAPHVAAAFAVLKSAAPDASVDQILNILKQTGVSISDTRTGIPNPPRITPRINLKKALDRLAPAADVPNIEVTPTYHNFGNVILGDSSTVTITISNTGNSDLEIGQLSLGNTDFVVSNDNCSNTTVAAGNNCTVTITFTPASEGVKTTKLSIPSNDPDTTVTKVNLRGKGLTNVDLIPEISVSPSSYDFGYVKVGHSSTVTVKISNTGNTDLEIGQLKLNGWNFELSNDNCSNTSISAGQHCTVKVTLAPLAECGKNGRLLIPSNDPENAKTKVRLIGNGVPEVVTHTATVAPASSELLYGVHDEGLNNSQFFTISTNDYTVNTLGPRYPGYDIEAIAIHPETCNIYAASGNDVGPGKKRGHLYKIDGQNGQISSVGSTCFAEVGDLAFSPDGTLWGWAKGDGLIEIDPTFGIATLKKASTTLVEGLTLNQEEEGVFYGSVNTGLWKYDRNTDQFNQICANLPGEMEALETMSDGLLLGGVHQDETLNLHAFQLEGNSCEVKAELAISTSPFDDVEGIALPRNCSP